MSLLNKILSSALDSPRPASSHALLKVESHLSLPQAPSNRKQRRYESVIPDQTPEPGQVGAEGRSGWELPSPAPGWVNAVTWPSHWNEESNFHSKSIHYNTSDIIISLYFIFWKRSNKMEIWSSAAGKLKHFNATHVIGKITIHESNWKYHVICYNNMFDSIKVIKSINGQ